MKKFLLFLLFIFNLFSFLRSADWVLDGASITVTWPYDLVTSPTGLGGGNVGTFKDIRVVHLSGDETGAIFNIMDDACQLVLQNATLSLSDDYTFGLGSLVARGDSSIVGISGKSFIFQGSNIAIEASSSLRIGPGITLDCETTGSGKQLIKYGNSNSELILDSATLKVDSTDDVDDGSGLMMVSGNLVIRGNSTIDNASTATMVALQLGNGSYSSSDCNLRIEANSRLTVKNAGVNFKEVAAGSLGTGGGLGTLDVDPGASFMVTTTYPIDLESGQLNLDFNTFSGITDSKFSDSLSVQITNTNHGDTIEDVEWSPDGEYLAMCGGLNSGGANESIRVFGFDGTNLIYRYGLNVSDGWRGAVSWHPSGNYLALGGGDGTYQNTIVYYFDGTNLTALPNCSKDHGDSIRGVDWSPDGRYLAVGGDNGTDNKEVRIYSFDSNSLTEVDSLDITERVWSIKWSNDGKYVAIAQREDKKVRVYYFDGSSLTALSGCVKDHGDDVFDLSWSPDDKYIAIVGATGGGYSVRVYSFDGSSLTELSGCSRNDHGSTLWACSWSPDGSYLAVGGSNGTDNYDFRVYSFDGTILKLLSNCNKNHSSQITSVSWSPNGEFVAFGGFASSNIEVRIYPEYFIDVDPKFSVEDGTLKLEGRSFVGNNIEIKAN